MKRLTPQNTIMIAMTLIIVSLLVSNKAYAQAQTFDPDFPNNFDQELGFPDSAQTIDNDAYYNYLSDEEATEISPGGNGLAPEQYQNGQAETWEYDLFDY